MRLAYAVQTPTVFLLAGRIKRENKEIKQVQVTSLKFIIFYFFLGIPLWHISWSSCCMQYHVHKIAPEICRPEWEGHLRSRWISVELGCPRLTSCTAEIETHITSWTGHGFHVSGSINLHYWIVFSQPKIRKGNFKSYQTKELIWDISNQDAFFVCFLEIWGVLLACALECGRSIRAWIVCVWQSPKYEIQVSTWSCHEFVLCFEKHK